MCVFVRACLFSFLLLSVSIHIDTYLLLLFLKLLLRLLSLRFLLSVSSAKYKLRFQSLSPIQRYCNKNKCFAFVFMFSIIVIDTFVCIYDKWNDILPSFAATLSFCRITSRLE